MVVNDKFCCDVLDDLIVGNFLECDDEVFEEISGPGIYSGMVADLTIFRG